MVEHRLHGIERARRHIEGLEEREDCGYLITGEARRASGQRYGESREDKNETKHAFSEWTHTE